MTTLLLNWMLLQGGLTPGAPLSTPTLIVNLTIDALLVGLLGMYYARFGRSLSNRIVSARTLIFISLTTVLVITVVKSSLALTLAMIGALSIVRFRTPIKDPEELGFIFLSVAIGLGLGADQRVATVIAFSFILAVLSLRAILLGRRRPHNLFLTVAAPDDAGADSTFRRMTDLVAEHVEVADLRRMDARDGQVEATFAIDCSDDRSLIAAIDHLKSQLPGASISFVDQEQALTA